MQSLRSMAELDNRPQFELALQQEQPNLKVATLNGQLDTTDLGATPHNGDYE